MRVNACQQRAHITTDPGEAQQAAAMVEQVFDLIKAHAFFAQQIKQHAGVDCATPGTHG
jgi:hypothetical protein